jgi:hypothetical protein
MIEIPIEDALEVSRHNEPQVGPQEWECGCVTEVFVTDRDYREDEKPFEMRLTKWCETDCQPWGMAQAGRVYRECDRYGLPHSAGALLRHIYNNRDAVFGFKDLSIELLEGKLAKAVEMLRKAGPAADPNAWHEVMQEIDPEYGAPGTPGEAHIALARAAERARQQDA